VEELSTEDSSGANFPEGQGVDSLAMVRPQEVLLYYEDGAKHLDGEGSPWLAIVTMVNDQTEVVELQHHAEVDERARLSGYEHGSLRNEEAHPH